jgi:hypothetical protein
MQFGHDVLSNRRPGQAITHARASSADFRAEDVDTYEIAVVLKGPAMTAWPDFNNDWT